MPINKVPVKAFTAGDLSLDIFTATADQTEFTLQISATDNSVIVTVNDVIQVPPQDYTVNGTTLTFTSGLELDDEVVVRTIGRPSVFGTVEDGAISSDKIAANAVNSSKLATGAIEAKLGYTPVTKEYVDEIAEGLKTKPAARAATTTNLLAIYDNGEDGVGATLTADSNRIFTTLDGVTNWQVGQGILIKNQTNAAHNGRYVLTDLGSVSTPWILTRCYLCDEANEIPGSYVFVTNGSINKDTGWVQVVADPSTFVVGTDAINVLQFSGAGSYTAGTGLQLNGSQFSLASGAAVANIGYTPVNKAGDTMTGTLALPSNGLVVGTNQLVVSSGNVGIGTATPISTLHIGDEGTTTTDTRQFIIDSNGFAGILIRGDRLNTSGEPGGAFLQLQTDGELTTSFLSHVQGAGGDGRGGSFTGTLSNSTLLATVGAGLLFGTEGIVRARIDGNGQQSSVIPGGTTLYPEFKCRAWVNFDGANGSIRGSGNVSSVTYRNTGRYTINFSTAMADDNYSIGGSAQKINGDGVAENDTLGPHSLSTSSFALQITDASGNTYQNCVWVHIQIFR
jgi:hypothetical protein